MRSVLGGGRCLHQTPTLLSDPQPNPPPPFSRSEDYGAFGRTMAQPTRN